MTSSNCRCELPPLDYRDFASTFVGVDETKGRFGEVTLERCRQCGRVWLRYEVEYEAFPQSGRWYRGLITEEQAEAVTPENAVEILQSLEGHLYGGPYFRHAGMRTTGSIFVDH